MTDSRTGWGILSLNYKACRIPFVIEGGLVTIFSTGAHYSFVRLRILLLYSDPLSYLSPTTRWLVIEAIKSRVTKDRNIKISHQKSSHKKMGPADRVIWLVIDGPANKLVNAISRIPKRAPPCKFSCHYYAIHVDGYYQSIEN